jgi:hypothetical protein
MSKKFEKEHYKVRKSFGHIVRKIVGRIVCIIFGHIDRNIFGHIVQKFVEHIIRIIFGHFVRNIFGHFVRKSSGGLVMTADVPPLDRVEGNVDVVLSLGNCHKKTFFLPLCQSPKIS